MTNQHLWDPSEPPDADVADLERALRPLKFDPRLHPLGSLPPRASGRRWSTLMAAGLAAALLVATVGAAVFYWRLQWPAGRAWPMQAASASDTNPGAQWPVGSALVTSSTEQAVVSIARLGTMEVGGGSQLSLSETGSSSHRLQMARGTIDVRLWAPPGRFRVQTPAGEVIDLGCVFSLTVDDDAATVVVATGWVELQNDYGHSLVPAGASASMRVGQWPQVPIFDDASDVFRNAVRLAEAPGGPPPAAVATLVAGARPRDVYTLLMLGLRLDDTAGAVRRQVVNRAAELSAPPPGVAVALAADGDSDVLWAWADALPLPPVKSWIRNWKDVVRPAFPR